MRAQQRKEDAARKGRPPHSLGELRIINILLYYNEKNIIHILSVPVSGRGQGSPLLPRRNGFGEK